MYLYLRTKKGLGEDQQSWMAPQAINRVLVEPVSIGCMGNFHEHLASPAEQTCYTVENFDPNSWGLPVDLQKKIQEIADDIVGKVKHKLCQLRKKTRKKAIVRLYLDIRAHFDAKTDTNRLMWDKGRKGGPFYWRRGTVVWNDLKKRLWNRLEELKEKRLAKSCNELKVKGRFRFSFFVTPNFDPQGAHPVSQKNPKKNRRVEVCIRDLVVEKEKE